ncbi:MAG TPA: DALR anticodon-binding domain-containing protein, partial [Fimbriimonadaceae bacterium]|nr:DALR anticodon-binding domain-containing protein [Fimbriimonadaceae bacterium]
LTVGVRHDILEAALLPDASSMLDPRGVRMRTKILGMADPDTDFVQTATRPLNILAAAERKGIPFASRDPLRSLEVENLQSDEALHLLERLRASEDPLFTACRAEDAQGVLEALLALKEPINTFFDSTMVMAEDPDVRYARLTLLAAAREQILVAGDFSKIVVEGD